MEKPATSPRESRHLRVTTPSPWVCRFAPLVPAGSTVLDLACGNGRNARHFLELGFPVVAVDQNVEAVVDLRHRPGAEVVRVDLEKDGLALGGASPLAGRTFGGIVGVNYLYRPLFPELLNALEAGGVFIYETFARGNEKYSRPWHPDHLLMSGELLELVRGHLQVVAYEHGIVERDVLPGVIQRICAVNNLGADTGDDGEPEPYPVRSG